MLLAERFHWQLDYIDSLPDDELSDVLGVIDGKEKALADMQKHA